MNQYTEFKKTYLRLKEDFMRAFSDHNSALELIKKGNNDRLSDWANKNINQLELERHLAMRRLQIETECFFYKNMKYYFGLDKTINGNEEELTVILDIRHEKGFSAIPLFSLRIDVYVFRDITYYDRFINDDKVHDDVYNVVNDYEVGRIDLRELEIELKNELDDYIDKNKDLQGADLYPIVFSSVVFRDIEIVEKELNYIVSSVDSKVEETVNRFVDKLNKRSGNI